MRGVSEGGATGDSKCLKEGRPSDGRTDSPFGDRREGQRQLGGTGPKFRGRPVRTGGRCGEGRAGVNAGHSLKRPRRWRRGARGLHTGRSLHPSSTAFWAPGSDPLSLLTVLLKRACGINILHPTSLQTPSFHTFTSSLCGRLLRYKFLP